MNQKKIADQLIIYCFWALIITTALLIILPGNILLLFLQLLFASALIGGIADWYGVTSIYARPFNIRYKTEVIIQDREKLVREIREFLTGDVLSPKNIKEKIEDFHFTQRFFDFLMDKKDGVRPVEEIIETVSRIFYKTVRDLDFEEITDEILVKVHEYTKDEGGKEEGIESLKREITLDRTSFLVESLSGQFLYLREVEELREYIYGKLEEFLKNYSGDHTSRKLLTLVFHGRIYEKFTEAIDRELYKLAKDPDHPLKEKWSRELYKRIQEKLEGDELKLWIEEKLEEKLQEQRLKKEIEDRLRQEIDKEIPSSASIEKRITPLVGRELLKIQEDPEKIQAIESKIIHFLSELIDKNHEKIGDLLEENIGKMSDGELVSFIKDNTEGDLQMIRLNGMAFGVMISMVVFIAKAFLGIL
ncbi:MAG: DUF445 family protein [Gallicola sp.]|nr:DUF445 family protein [Gallicola sp.]